MTAELFPRIHFSSRSDEWSTPDWLVSDLADEFGPFTLDPCATPETAKAALTSATPPPSGA